MFTTKTGVTVRPRLFAVYLGLFDCPLGAVAALSGAYLNAVDTLLEFDVLPFAGGEVGNVALVPTEVLCNA